RCKRRPRGWIVKPGDLVSQAGKLCSQLRCASEQPAMLALAFAVKVEPPKAPYNAHPQVTATERFGDGGKSTLGNCSNKIFKRKLISVMRRQQRTGFEMKFIRRRPCRRLSVVCSTRHRATAHTVYKKWRGASLLTVERRQRLAGRP